MDTFGIRSRTRREDKGFSRQEFSKKLSTYHSLIGKHERDEMTTSAEVSEKMAQLLHTTVGYLLGEVNQTDTFKDPVMLKRLHRINNVPENDKHFILYTIHNLLASAVTKLAYSK